MSSFKQLSKADVFVVPYIANKQWNLVFSSIPLSSSLLVLYQGRNITGSFNSNQVTTSLGEYQNLVYSSINHLFYQKYTQPLNTQSLMMTVDNYVSASSQRPTSSYFVYNDKIIKNFPTSSNQTIQVFSVSQDLYGEGILPHSFRLAYGANNIKDDGLGNLYNNTTFVGNIFYSHGIAVFTNQSFQTITYPLSCSFQNKYTVYENYITCKVKESECNLSYNTSLIKSGSNSELKDFTTSSFSPYTTTIGLYNENNDLLMVAKLAQPIQISSETDMTFLIRYDS